MHANKYTQLYKPIQYTHSATYLLTRNAADEHVNLISIKRLTCSSAEFLVIFRCVWLFDCRSKSVSTGLDPGL